MRRDPSTARRSSPAALASALRGGLCCAAVVPVLLWLALAASPALAARGPGGAVITTTINTAFGTDILVPGTGIILNNERDDFSLAPGVPNVYDLVGGDSTP